MMLFPLLILCFAPFRSYQSLVCLDQCSRNYTFDEKFSQPENCSSIPSYRCTVELIFWFNRRNYSVIWRSESSVEVSSMENRHFLMIETRRNPFFSYDIHYTCRSSDDCIRQYVEETIFQMLQKTFNLSVIYYQLEQILYQRAWSQRNLACFDLNDSVKQCSIPGTIGFCQIVDDLLKYKLHRRSCRSSDQPSVGLNIFDSEQFAAITINCNRMLCNGPLIIPAVKKLLRHHNITDVHGRIYSRSSTRFSSYFLSLIFNVFFSLMVFCNQFSLRRF